MATIRNIVTSQNIAKISLDSSIFDAPKTTQIPNTENLTQLQLQAFDTKIASLEGNYEAQQELYAAKKEFAEILEKLQDNKLQNYNVVPVYADHGITKEDYMGARREFDAKIKSNFRKFLIDEAIDYFREIRVSKYIINAFSEGYAFQESFDVSIDHKIEIALGGKLVKEKSPDLVNEEYETKDINHFANLNLVNDKIHSLKNRLIELQYMVIDKNTPQFILTIVPNLSPDTSLYANLVDDKTSPEFGIKLKSNAEVAKDMVSYLNSQPRHLMLYGKKKFLALSYITAELKSQTKSLSENIDDIEKIRALHDFYKNPELIQLYKKVRKEPLQSVARLRQAMAEAGKLVSTTSIFEQIEKKVSEPRERVKKEKTASPIIRAPKEHDITADAASYSKTAIARINKFLSEVRSSEKLYSSSLDVINSLLSNKKFISLQKEAAEVIEQGKTPNHENLAFYRAYNKCTVILKSTNKKISATFNSISDDEKEASIPSMTKSLNRAFDKSTQISDSIYTGTSLLKHIYRSTLSNSTYKQAIAENNAEAQNLKTVLDELNKFLLSKGYTAEDLSIVKPEIAEVTKAKKEKTKQVKREPKEKLSRKQKKLNKKLADAEALASISDNSTKTEFNGTAQKTTAYPVFRKSDNPLSYAAKLINFHASRARVSKNVSSEELFYLYSLTSRMNNKLIAESLKPSDDTYKLKDAVNSAKEILSPMGYQFEKPASKTKPEEKIVRRSYGRKPKVEVDPSRFAEANAQYGTAVKKEKRGLELLISTSYNCAKSLKKGIRKKADQNECLNELFNSYSEILENGKYRQYCAQQSPKLKHIDDVLDTSRKVLVDNGFMIK